MSQGGASNDSQPSSGQPGPAGPRRINFGKQYWGHFIPNAVMNRRELTPGARLLWALIVTFSRRTGWCTAADATLGRRLGVSIRQVKRYLRQLEKDGWLQTEQRVGTTARRYLLEHPLLDFSLQATRAVNVTGEGQIGHVGVSDVAHIVNQSRDILESRVNLDFSPGGPFRKREMEMKSAGEVLEHVAKALDGKPSMKEKHPNAGLIPLGALAEHAAVRREIEFWKFPCSEALLQKLLSKAAFYGRNGFQVAAAINRATRKAQHSPSYAPKGEQWFSTVVENEFRELGKTAAAH